MTHKSYPHLHSKGNSLYYVRRRRGEKPSWIKVGTIQDELAAIERYTILYQAENLAESETVAGMIKLFKGLLADPRNPLNLKPRTIGEYVRQLKDSGNLVQFFGHMARSNVRPIHIGTYLTEHPKHVMANRDIALLSRIYSHSIGRGMDLINPCLHIKKNIEVSRNRYVQDWEFALVRSHQIRPVQIAMDVAYLTGQRLSVILAIQVNHYDTEFLRVTETKTDTRARIIMNESLHQALEQHEDLFSTAKQFSTIVRTRTGKQYSLTGFESIWRRGLKKAMDNGLGEWFTFHDIRAKHATDKDESSFNAQLALGHVDIATTKKYLRHPQGRKVEALNLLPRKKC